MNQEEREEWTFAKRQMERLLRLIKKKRYHNQIDLDKVSDFIGEEITPEIKKIHSERTSFISFNERTEN